MESEGTSDQRSRTAPGPRRAWKDGTGAGLGVVVMVVVTMMVPAGCEHGACTHQQQNGGNDELLHAMKIARFQPVNMPRKTQESSRLRVTPGVILLAAGQSFQTVNFSDN